MNAPTPHYSMLIEWSNLDNAYVVSFPEWEHAGHLTNTHGDTYMEAAQKGQEMLNFLIGSAAQLNESAPTPALFDTHASAPNETADDIVRESQALLREIGEQGARAAQDAH